MWMSRSKRGWYAFPNFTSCQNATCSNKIFPLLERFYTFSLSKCDFSCLFHTDGAHIDLLWFCLWSAAFQIILLQRHKKFRCLIIFSWQHAIKNSDGQMRQIYLVGWKWSTRRSVEGGMSTGLTNKHTARGFSDLYHVFARKNAFSVLHYVMVVLHYSMLHRFKIFSAPGTIAHDSIRLPPRSLGSSRGCSLAIITGPNLQKWSAA